MLYVQKKGETVRDYAHLMQVMNLATAEDESWFRAAFLDKFEEHKIQPDNEPSMHLTLLESESTAEIRFSLPCRRNPQHRQREYVEVTIPLYVHLTCQSRVG